MRAEGRKKKKRNATPQGRNATQMLARRGQMQTEIAMKGGKNYSKSEACCTPADIT